MVGLFRSIAKPWTEKDPKRVTAYNLAHANLLATKQRFDPEDSVSWKALEAKLSRIKQAGATPILVIAPNLAQKRYFPPEFAGKPASPAILDFSDPREHPELFVIDQRLDGQHLNYDGAVIFTEEVARQISRDGEKGRPEALKRVASISHQSTGSRAWIVAVFFIAFAASCGLLGQCLPFPQVLIVRDKIEHLARHGDDYDVVFIGSSHIQGQVMPSVFDAMASRGGVHVKSFNAGVAGMFAPEDGYMVEQILKRPHHRLRWVFFELSHVRTSLERAGTALRLLPRLAAAQPHQCTVFGRELCKRARSWQKPPMPV